jgi:hypothetical protein
LKRSAKIYLYFLLKKLYRLKLKGGLKLTALKFQKKYQKSGISRLTSIVLIHYFCAVTLPSFSNFTFLAMKTSYKSLSISIIFFLLTQITSAQTFTYNSSTTVTIPIGITTVTAKVLGAGEKGNDGGSNFFGTGGGGAGFCMKTFAVQAGQNINIVVGTSAGTKTSSVTHSESSTNLIANGGNQVSGLKKAIKISFFIIPKKKVSTKSNCLHQEKSNF